MTSRAVAEGIGTAMLLATIVGSGIMKVIGVWTAHAMFRSTSSSYRRASAAERR